MERNNIRPFTLPNFITLANLFCGCMALIWTLAYGDLATAFLFMVAAAVLDFLDGFTARLLKSYSDVGVQLDSLSDMVSFGVVPAVMLFWIYNSGGGSEWFAAGAFIPFLLTMFSALRLAIFNIDTEQKTGFIGLPTPASAILIGSCAWLYQKGVYDITPVMVLVASVILSFLLISPIRMFSLKFTDYSFKNNWLRYGFLLLSVIPLAIWGIRSVPVIIAAYIITSIAMDITDRIRA